jgi:ribosomal-protein-alanine N-acetyltransferase
LFNLRDIKPNDYIDLYQCGNDTEARKFFDPLAFQSLDALEKYFKDFFLPLKKETIIPPQIIELNNKVIGIIYFCHLKETKEGKVSELGFVLHKDYRGQGIITKASKIMLERAFMELKVDLMKISCLPTNEASKAVAKKLGMTFSQYWYSGDKKICLFKLTKKQYKKMKNSE